MMLVKNLPLYIKSYNIFHVQSHILFQRGFKILQNEVKLSDSERNYMKKLERWRQTCTL